MENEFRVRPVTRYSLTHYKKKNDSGVSSVIGEFPGYRTAEEVARAMKNSIEGATIARHRIVFVVVRLDEKQHVIGQPTYAASFDTANGLKNVLQREDGCEYRVLVG